MGWSGWDQDRVMLSTVRLTWCMMDTAEGAARETETVAQSDTCTGRTLTLPAAGQDCLELWNSLPALGELPRGQEILDFAVSNWGRKKKVLLNW